jgi:hypothetical protein
MSTDTRSAEERRKSAGSGHKVQYFMTAADYLFWSDWERCNLEDRFQKPDPVLMAMTQEGADGVHDTTEGAFPEDGIELELSPAASQVLKGGLITSGRTCGHCSRLYPLIWHCPI